MASKSDHIADQMSKSSGQDQQDESHSKGTFYPKDSNTSINNDNPNLGAGDSTSRTSQYDAPDSSSSNSQLSHDKENQKNEEAVDEVPDGSIISRQTIGCFLLNMGSWGANSGFAVYLNYDLSNNVFKGADKTDYALIGGFALGLGILFCPLINALQGVLGTRGLILLGNILQFLGVFLASFTKKLWQLYLTQGLLNAIGLACISLPTITILPQWYKKKRTFASGIATGGSGIGGIMFNLGMQKLLETRSVWWALRAQAIICFGLVLVGGTLVKPRIAKKVEFTFFDKAVVSCAAFPLLVVFAITCMFAYAIILYTLVNFTVSLGYTSYQGSIASAMVQLGSFLGRPTVGFFADKIGASNMSVVVYTLSTIFVLAMWLPARNLATVYAFGIIIGSIMGSIYGLLPVIVARLVGLKKLNVAFSMIWSFIGAAGIVAPVIGLTLTTSTVGPDQYTHCIIFSGCAFAVSALCLFIVRGYIIARDKIAGDNSNPDLGQLQYTVPFKAPLLNLFHFGKV